jgi:hypothetical protein
MEKSVDALSRRLRFFGAAFNTSQNSGNLFPSAGVYRKLCQSSEVRVEPMVIIALFGGLVIGGAIFAVLKNSGSRATNSKYTKLNIG